MRRGDERRDSMLRDAIDDVEWKVEERAKRKFENWGNQVQTEVAYHPAALCTGHRVAA